MMKHRPPQKWRLRVGCQAPSRGKNGTILPFPFSLDNSQPHASAPMRIDHSASTIVRPHFAAIDDLSSADTLVCEPVPCAAPAADDVATWETEIGYLPDGLVMSDDDEEETNDAAGEVDDFDEDDFDDEFDDDFEEELEDEYDLADLEEVSAEDLEEDDADLPIGGDFVDEDEEPEEPALPEDPDAPAAEEEEKPKKGKGKAKGKGKKKDDDDDEDLDLDDDE